MCDSKDFNEFPAITIGGPTGDYFVQCPVTSARWAEYSIVGISNGDGGTPSSIVVSGDSPPKAMMYDGSNKLSDDGFMHGMPFRLTATQQAQSLPTAYERITHSQKRVFVRIDAAASNSVYVTLRFRVRILDTIPGPAHTTHPDHMRDLNVARAKAVRERTGMRAEIQEGEGLNARR